MGYWVRYAGTYWVSESAGGNGKDTDPGAIGSTSWDRSPPEHAPSRWGDAAPLPVTLVLRDKMGPKAGAATGVFRRASQVASPMQPGQVPLC